MFLKIGFDGGYGNTKVVTSTGKKLEIPSVVGGGFRRQYADVFGHAGRISPDNLHVRLDGRDYFVGSLALKESRTSSSAFNANKINHPNTRVITAAATALLMDQEKENMIIVASLPFVEFKKQKNELKDYLSSFEAEVTLFDGEREIKREVRFRHAAVFPQGAAAVNYIMDQYSEYADMENTVLAVVDIGMKTLDVVVIEIGEQIRIIESMSFGFHTGVSLIHDHLYRAVQEKTDISLNLPELDVILKQEGKWYRHDFTEAVEIGKRELMRMIDAEINERWGEKERERISKVFLVGGGGELLYDEFRNSNELRFIRDDIELPLEPRFANAYGCLKVAENIEEIILSQNVNCI